jgi:hypothetical protein
LRLLSPLSIILTQTHHHTNEPHPIRLLRARCERPRRQAA